MLAAESQQPAAMLVFKVVEDFSNFSLIFGGQHSRCLAEIWRNAYKRYAQRTWNLLQKAGELN